MPRTHRSFKDPSKGSLTSLTVHSVHTTNLNLTVFFQKLPFADTALITAASPIFTVFFARLFIKEPVLIIDLINVAFIVFGMVLIVKPGFIFGYTNMFEYDSEAVYALIAVISSSLLLQPNVYIILRLLKGSLKTPYY